VGVDNLVVLACFEGDDKKGVIKFFGEEKCTPDKILAMPLYITPEMQKLAMPECSHELHHSHSHKLYSHTSTHFWQLKSKQRPSQATVKDFVVYDSIAIG